MPGRLSETVYPLSCSRFAGEKSEKKMDLESYRNIKTSL